MSLQVLLDTLTDFTANFENTLGATRLDETHHRTSMRYRKWTLGDWVIDSWETPERLLFRWNHRFLVSDRRPAYQELEIHRSQSGEPTRLIFSSVDWPKSCYVVIHDYAACTTQSLVRSQPSTWSNPPVSDGDRYVPMTFDSNQILAITGLLPDFICLRHRPLVRALGN